MQNSIIALENAVQDFMVGLEDVPNEYIVDIENLVNEFKEQMVARIKEIAEIKRNISLLTQRKRKRSSDEAPN